jgi:hypothetical protein
MPRFPKTPWWLLGLLAMTGCASSPKFQCPTPNGVACMSVTEVYQATEYSADVHRSDVAGDGSIAVTETAPPAWMAPTGTPSVVAPSADLQIDDGSIVLTDEPDRHGQERVVVERCPRGAGLGCPLGGHPWRSASGRLRVLRGQGPSLASRQCRSGQPPCASSAAKHARFHPRQLPRQLALRSKSHHRS